MVLELAILNVIPGKEAGFELAFAEARAIIGAKPGFVSFELQKCVEQPIRSALLVRWSNLEDHTVGFRQSAQYQRWRALLHHFYDPFPQVEHYTRVDV
jgi:heme-degrading monooxygenase HmoA